MKMEGHHPLLQRYWSRPVRWDWVVSVFDRVVFFEGDCHLGRNRPDPIFFSCWQSSLVRIHRRNRSNRCIPHYCRCPALNGRSLHPRTNRSIDNSIGGFGMHPTAALARVHHHHRSPRDGVRSPFRPRFLRRRSFRYYPAVVRQRRPPLAMHRSSHPHNLDRAPPHRRPRLLSRMQNPLRLPSDLRPMEFRSIHPPPFRPLRSVVRPPFSTEPAPSVAKPST